MKKFEAEKKGIIVRDLKELTIIFYDKKTIYVYPRGSSLGSIFHIWGAPRGSYSNWRDFRRKLLNYRHLTLTRCYELAIQHDIVGTSTLRHIELDDQRVIHRS